MNTLHARFAGVFQPDNGCAAHAPEQFKWHAATADEAAFVFQDEAACALCSFSEQVNSNPVLEIDLNRLVMHAASKAGAAVVGMAFKIHAVVQLRQDVGFARSRHAAQNEKFALIGGAYQGVQQKPPQGFIAASDSGIVDPRLFT